MRDRASRCRRRERNRRREPRSRCVRRTGCEREYCCCEWLRLLPPALRNRSPALPVSKTSSWFQATPRRVVAVAEEAAAASRRKQAECKGRVPRTNAPWALRSYVCDCCEGWNQKKLSWPAAERATQSKHVLHCTDTRTLLVLRHARHSQLGGPLARAMTHIFGRYVAESYRYRVGTGCSP